MTTLIVGQGIAGSILAIELLKAGIDVIVIDDGHLQSASKVAAGLMDYVSGKRLTKSWNSDVLIPYAKQFYKQLEQELGTSFFFERPSLRYFSTKEQVDFYHKRLEDPKFEGSLTKRNPPHLYDAMLHNDFGACIVEGSSVLNTPSFLLACKQFLEQNNSLITEPFDFDSFETLEKGIRYKDILAEKIIFCEGYNVCKNPYFKGLDFRLSKGDVLTLDIADLPQEFILNKDKWLVPFNSMFRFGATYEWKTINCTADQQGQDELVNDLKGWLKLNYQVVNHEAGVRTAAKDIRPVFGFHPDYDNIGIFNGFSSKGVMTVPYYAREFLKSLQSSDNKLSSEINCKRLFLNRIHH
ncbi:hypothetical protein DID80_02845 [Candidatus Marinamargulisbacteria bacterium SCGC AAA071-K20]|nr:hypothetical protein DID80_02845 [Candidatus Marinamargulisbacteria bacterium SCGC AAA071-K20]